MRFLIAMLFAIAGALAVTLYVASPLATWAVAQYSFQSPDEVSTLHGAIYMGVNLAGLLAGWTIGWFIGGLFEGKKARH